MSSSVTVDKALLIQVIELLIANQQFNPASNEEQQKLQFVTNKALDAITSSVAQQSGGVQSFSSGQIGSCTVDGSKSSYL